MISIDFCLQVYVVSRQAGNHGVPGDEAACLGGASEPAHGRAS